MSGGSNYMELPAELKLKILWNLNNKDVKQCRMVCKRFVPRNIGIAFGAVNQRYFIRTRLNLSSKVDTFTSVDLNMIKIKTAVFSDSDNPEPLPKDPDQRYFYLESLKEVPNLEEVPASLMENINWLVLLGSKDNPPLLTNLDIENYTRIKLCQIVCAQGPQKLEEMFASSQTELTHLTFGISEIGISEIGLDCASLHDCSRLEYLNLFSDVSVINMDQLPTSLKTLKVDVIPMGVDIRQLEWIYENLLELQGLSLAVNEDDGEFSVEMFKDVCSLPSLTRMLLAFPLTHQSDAEGPDMGTLLTRLEEMRNLEGVNAVYKQRQDPRPNRHPLDILIEFEVNIQRQPSEPSKDIGTD